jgi:V8-like Glu-specific endopeptidase
MKLIPRSFYFIFSLFFIIAAYPQTVFGQVDLPPFHSESYTLDSGIHDGKTDEVVVAFQEEIHVTDAAWLRLHFGDYFLGKGSYITIASVKDGSIQHLNARTISQWQGSSAFFNGDSLLVKLHAAPGDENIFFQIVRITVGEYLEAQIGIQSLCDDDDERSPSTDSRVGRLFGGGCTAFLISNGAVLTAGHCVDWDPDEDGPLLPDGISDLSGVVEFNVPLSAADGTPQAANADDQYPIDLTSVEWHFDGEGQGYGKDWAVFSIFPNTNNGDRAHDTHGFFRVTCEKPAVNDIIQITGFGIDEDPPGSTGSENKWSYTEQTDIGEYKGEIRDGDDIRHEYRVDTRPANSGSPIIWWVWNVVIGIHTNGGCDAADGTNKGTSFEHDPLERALEEFQGVGVTHVDGGMPNLAAANGTVDRPYFTVLDGILAAPDSGTVSIVKGSYNERFRTSKALRLVAPVGSVTIGR